MNNIFNNMKKITLSFVLAFASSLALISCGGGGSSGSSSPTSTATPSATTYVSGVAVGDFGEFIISADRKTYTFKFIDSAYGLTGVSLSGSLTEDANGGYIGTTKEGKRFPVYITENYAIASVQMNPKTDPNDFTPIFGIAKGSAISSASSLVNQGNVIKSFSYLCNANKTQTTATSCYSVASIGVFSVGSNDKELLITNCNNGGKQEDNSLLSLCYQNRNNPSWFSQSAQLNNSGIERYTATYDAVGGYWNMTPNVNSSSRVTRGVFTLDKSTNSLVGFFDEVGLTAGTASGFSFVTNNFTPIGNFSRDVYINILPKQSLASGGSGGHGFQQQLIKANGQMFDQCPSGGSGPVQIASNMDSYVDQVDTLTPTQMAIPGFDYERSKAADRTDSSDWYVLGSFISNINASSGLGVFVANNSKTSSQASPTNNFKLIYFTPTAGQCY
jgi:hypothetical protein